MQVLTPILLRTLIDGIFPSKDGSAIAAVLIIIGLNELFLLLGNSLLNRELDKLENQRVQDIRKWMMEQIGKFSVQLRGPEEFYESWKNESRRLAYRNVKNIWYRAKDFIILILLSFICLNISYLAGGLVLIIALLSFAMVFVFKDRQGADFKLLNQIGPQEKEIFNQLINPDQPLKNKELTIATLMELGHQTDELQFRITQQRTLNQDLNNGIRFVLMFSILGVGGYLFATEKLSMGSLWALLITMYRITPSLQGTIRWILQSNSDENLEERILNNMKTKEGFQKPAYYNRLVKVLNKAIKSPGKRLVLVDPSIEDSSLLDSLELWKSFYSKKDSVVISRQWPESPRDEKFMYLLVTHPLPDLPASCVIFTRENAPDLNLFPDIESLKLN